MTKTLYLGAGCFWGVEDALGRVNGVVGTNVGYAGGTLPEPTYEQVCTGRTGHAEVVRVEYDPEETTQDNILEVFWSIHDPTTRDRQGPDRGSQYRSVILVQDDAETDWAWNKVKEAGGSRRWRKDVVTTVEPLGKYYPAESYHQQYLQKNPGGYCHISQRVRAEIH